MKTVYIPKGETVHYESLTTEHLVVHGRLHVTYGVKAQSITGSGVIDASSINADTVCIDDVESGTVICKRLIAKRVQAPEVFASESAAVSCFLSAAYTPGEQRNTLAKLLLVQIDSPEDLPLHLPRSVIHTEMGMDLIPANKRLADAAARLQVMQLSQYNAAGASNDPSEKIMATLLTSFYEQYDYIIIDCGLKHELLTINALAAADYCIIPVQAHFLASEGIPDVLEMVKNVQNRFNPDLKIAGILLTMYQSRPQLCQSVRNSVNDIYGESLHVFERPIEQTIKAAECPAAGMSILDYAPKNPAAESYRSLALEVLHLA